MRPVDGTWSNGKGQLYFTFTIDGQTTFVIWVFFNQFHLYGSFLKISRAWSLVTSSRIDGKFLHDFLSFLSSIRGRFPSRDLTRLVVCNVKPSSIADQHPSEDWSRRRAVWKQVCRWVTQDWRAFVDQGVDFTFPIFSDGTSCVNQFGRWIYQQGLLAKGIADRIGQFPKSSNARFTTNSAIWESNLNHDFLLIKFLVAKWVDVSLNIELSPFWCLH